MSSRESEFARVYDEHLRHVYGFLAYRLRDRDLAEDLTQATFERALRAWPRFDPKKASERTWLLTIARNRAIDHLRSLSARMDRNSYELDVREHPSLFVDMERDVPGKMAESDWQRPIQMA